MFMDDYKVPAYKTKEFEDAFAIFDPNGAENIDFKYMTILMKTLMGIDSVNIADVVPEEAKNQQVVGLDSFLKYGAYLCLLVNKKILNIMYE